MNDKFLYQYRPPVRKAFADDLRQRLSALDPNQCGIKKGTMTMRQTTLSGNRWKFALPTLISLSLLFSIFAFSSPVRAKAMELIRVIAGFVVEERSESPLGVSHPDEVPPTQMAAINPAIVTEAAPVSMSKVQPTEYMIPTVSVTELIGNPPFQFGFPTWVPNGYTLDETAGIATSSSWVSFVWNNSDQGEIELLIERDYTGYNIPAGEDSSEEIEINGAPALLIRGFWDAQQQWDPERGISLDWEKDDHHYRLNYTERGPIHNEIVPIQGNMDNIIEQLVKMAESVP